MFGVLLVNLFEERVDPHTQHSAVQQVVWFLADSKFYPILSFLFGVGFALQFARLTERGTPAVLIYARRSAALVGIGILAYAALMANTVLLQYGAMGLALLMFRKASSRLVLTGAVFFALLSIFYGPISAITHPRAAGPPRPAAVTQGPQVPRINPEQAALKSGSFGEITIIRASRILRQLTSSRFWLSDLLWQRFALFLLGLCVARLGGRTWPTIDPRTLRKTARIGLIVGLLGNALFLIPAIARPTGSGLPLFGALVARRVLSVLTNPALGFGYAACLLLLVDRSTGWRARSAALGFVGRTALSNFLLQYAFILLLFWFQRWGVIGDTSATAAVILSIGVFALEVQLSRWWLDRFRFGPAEWLWRALTYWTLPPLRIERTAIYLSEA